MIERVGQGQLGDGPDLQPAWLPLQEAAALSGISAYDLRWLAYFNRLKALRGKHRRPLMIRHEDALMLRGKRCIWRRVLVGRRRQLLSPYLEDKQ
jgi:hypothetical protein